jgi:LPS export ABC transporter protein LptC
MSKGLYRVVSIALLVMGSAILLFSCKSNQKSAEESLDAIKTEESENLTIVMSENGRKSYVFTTPLLEGYTLGRDPYREFRKGVTITTYQDDAQSTVNAVLVANYAIYYENRKLWEAKGDVVITKHDGTRLYTQQLFWNSMTKRIYSNVDTKLVTDTDEVIGEGFESDEEMNEPRFRRWKGKMQVDTEQIRKDMKEDDEATEAEEQKEPEVVLGLDGEPLKDRNAPDPEPKQPAEEASEQERTIKRPRPMGGGAFETPEANGSLSRPVPSKPMEMGKRPMPGRGTTK